MMTNLGLIPARGGSKSLPRKNIQVLGGKPLIGYTIEAALSSKLLSRIVVSTDDHEIKQIALGMGAEVPFLRPDHLSADQSTDKEVISHAIDWYERQNIKINNIVYLRPTTPFKTGEIIDNCLKKLMASEYSGLRTVTKVEGVYHPYWMFKVKADCLASFVDNIGIDKYYQRQLLPDCYRLNGLVDILRIDEIKKGGMYGNKVGYVVIDEYQSIDIDTQNDLDYCEFLIKTKRNLEVHRK